MAGVPGNGQVVPVAVHRKSAPTAPPLGRISESVGANLELLSMGIIGLQTDLPENGIDGAQRGGPKNRVYARGTRTAVCGELRATYGTDSLTAGLLTPRATHCQNLVEFGDGSWDLQRVLYMHAHRRFPETRAGLQGATARVCPTQHGRHTAAWSDSYDRVGRALANAYNRSSGAGSSCCYE